MARLRMALMASAILWARFAGASEDPGAEIRAAIARFDTAAHFPLPELSDRDVERLLKGKLVRIREVPEDRDLPQRVVGLQVMDHPKEQVWVAARDWHESALEEMIEADLGPTADHHDRWYQYLDLPVPFADRHWVIEVWDNHAVPEATGGAAWEHPWELTEGGEALALEAVREGRIPGMDEARFERAVYTPVNRGAWAVLSLGDDETLLVYHVTTVVGGNIPDGLVARYSLFTLGRLFDRIEDRFPSVLEHYDADHEPFPGGDGRPIPPFSQSAEQAIP